MAGADFRGTTLNSVTFSRSNLGGADFSGAWLVDVEFSDSDVFDRVSFEAATLDSVSFDSVPGQGGSFVLANRDEFVEGGSVELHDSALSGLDFTASGLEIRLVDSRITNSIWRDLQRATTIDMVGDSTLDPAAGPWANQRCTAVCVSVGSVGPSTTRMPRGELTIDNQLNLRARTMGSNHPAPCHR